MQRLNLPSYSFRIKKSDQQTSIFDPIRKKFLKLTPEEWVRQNFVQFLIDKKGYPASLIAIEAGITLNGLQKRCDVIIYNNEGIPLVIVECKAPSIKINQGTFEQIARYNMVMKVTYLIVTNGLEHYCCQIDYQNDSYQFLQDIPTYES